MTGLAEMQSASRGLLGVHGDGVVDSSSRRTMTPHREYPIFTPGFRELGTTSINSESQSFQESPDGQRIWKEIHTDTGGGGGGGGGGANSAATSPLTPSTVSAASGGFMEAPAVLMSPASGGGRIAMNTTGSNYYGPGTPTQTYKRVMRGSPSTVVPHSPQNVNILSPQLRPLEKSPKRTQLHIANPRVTANGGLSPMVNQLTLSPGPNAFDHDSGVDLHPTLLPPAAAVARSPMQVPRIPLSVTLHPTLLPPAAAVARSPMQVSLSTPVGTPMSSTMKLKKMLKSAQGSDQNARPSVSKDRSPGRTWKSSFRGAMSPSTATGGARGMTRGDLNNSFQGGNTAAGRATAAAVNSSAVPSWRDRGDGAGVQAMDRAPAHDREICQVDFSGDLERSGELPQRLGGKKVASTHKSGSYNIFNFRSWGKKKSGGSSNNQAGVNHKQSPESFVESDEFGSVKADSDSLKVLDYTIKTLRYKLEQANQKRASAVDEVCALQSALEASDEKVRQLTHRCNELELKLSARSSGLWDIEELEADRRSSSSNTATYIVGRRDPDPPVPAPIARFPSQELTPEGFLKVFEDAIATLRRLASAICHHIRENGESATQVITALLEQHKVGRAVARMPRNVIILYFESFLNQVMFESFENVSFEPNGASSVFCPDTLKQQSYQAFQSLKGQEWSTIEKSLGKPGALVVNANFHRFFVVRMELILSQLGKLAENEISLQLMAAFFNAVKAVWLVHHMAFAFDHPVSIFRVSPASDFDARFMEQVTAFEEEQQAGARSKISIMLNPGFIVNRQIIKCQVYCSNT